MRTGRPRKNRNTVHTATHLTRAERRALEAACEAEPVPMSIWIRRLIVGELSRLQVREQLKA